MFKIPESEVARLNMVIDLGWDIFYKRVTTGRIKINNEASMQLHYASILHGLGELLCIKTGEIFDVEMESTVGRKNIDITCSYGQIRAAVELKCFRKISNRAADLDMYDSLKDIERLFLYKDFQVKKFICLTDNPYYIKGNHAGHASNVSIKDGIFYKKDQPITPSWIGKWKDSSRDKEIVFSNDVQLTWASDAGGQWYYLKLDL